MCLLPLTLSIDESPEKLCLSSLGFIDAFHLASELVRTFLNPLIFKRH